MDLGELSTLLVVGATTAYAIGFVAFAFDLAHLADRVGRPAARLAADASEAAASEAAASDGGGAREAGGTTVVAAPADVVPHRRAVGIAMATTTLGLAFHGVGLLLRGLAAGRVPWANMYEFTVVGTFVAPTGQDQEGRHRDERADHGELVHVGPRHPPGGQAAQQQPDHAGPGLPRGRAAAA